MYNLQHTTLFCVVFGDSAFISRYDIFFFGRLSDVTPVTPMTPRKQSSLVELPRLVLFQPVF